MIEIIAHRLDGINRRELMDVLYADDPNGGPMSQNIIAVMVRESNLQLIPQGWHIVPSWKGRGARWQLREIGNGDSERQPSTNIHARSVARSKSAGKARRD